MCTFMCACVCVCFCIYVIFFGVFFCFAVGIGLFTDFFFFFFFRFLLLLFFFCVLFLSNQHSVFLDANFHSLTTHSVCLTLLCQYLVLYLFFFLFFLMLLYFISLYSVYMAQSLWIPKMKLIGRRVYAVVYIILLSLFFIFFFSNNLLACLFFDLRGNFSSLFTSHEKLLSLIPLFFGCW